jgi:hypothetical protein
MTGTQDPGEAQVTLARGEVGWDGGWCVTE